MREGTHPRATIFVMPRILFATLSLFLAAAPVFAATPPKPAAAARPASASKPDAARPDGELERSIRERFARSKISADQFTVRVQSGVAILEGRTDVVQHKGTATRLARLAGARRVDNRIQISEEARRRAARKLESSRRRVQVKRSEQ